MTKIAVSLPDEQVQAAKRAVAAGRAASVSAFVSDALARAVREDSLTELLEEMNQELGEPSQDVRDEVDAELRRVGLLG